MYETNYYVDEKKGVVVCKITNVRCSVHDDMEKKQISFPTSMMCELLQIIPDSYVGKAKCSGDDKFDAKTGRSIAYKRAMKKVNRGKARFMRRFVGLYTEDYKETVKIMNSLVQRYEKAEANAEDGLKAIMETINQ